MSELEQNDATKESVRSLFGDLEILLTEVDLRDRVRVTRNGSLVSGGGVKACRRRSEGERERSATKKHEPTS